MEMDAKVELQGFEERFIEARGCRLRCLLAGGGEPLLLVHGLGGAAANWLALAPLLLPGRAMLVPDLPGHGGSEALPAAQSLNAYADRLALLLDRPAAVVGHSLGGAIALRLAIRRPELVSALVLARGGLPAPPALPAEIAEAFLSGAAQHTDTVSAAKALVRDDPRGDLDRVQCPVLLLWGARDHQLPIDDAFDYARRLRAPLRVIADCGHLLIGERPQACADAIEAFLSRDGV